MIDRFFGENRFLSNFWPAKVILSRHGVEYIFPTVEHAYQAAKCEDADSFFKILRAEKPGEAKKLGKTCILTIGWEQVKLAHMEDLVRQKFSTSEELRNKLLATGDQELVEGNTWGDTFWGVCNGKGENHLGKILMKVREELHG